MAELRRPSLRITKSSTATMEWWTDAASGLHAAAAARRYGAALRRWYTTAKESFRNGLFLARPSVAPQYNNGIHNRCRRGAATKPPLEDVERSLNSARPFLSSLYCTHSHILLRWPKVTSKSFLSSLSYLLKHV